MTDLNPRPTTDSIFLRPWTFADLRKGRGNVSNKKVLDEDVNRNQWSVSELQIPHPGSPVLCETYGISLL